MQVYLAHNYGAKDWLNENVVPYLTETGHRITSTWLDNLPGDRQQDALKDIDDIRSSDYVIFFADQFGPTQGRGKFAEFGFSVSHHEPYKIIVVSEDIEKRIEEFVFLALPDLKIVKSIQEARAILDEGSRQIPEASSV
jgi:hypothetical protein